MNKAVLGSETGAVTEMDMNRLGKWERKILRWEHGGTAKKIRTDQELREMNKEVYITAGIKKRDWNGLDMQYECFRGGNLRKYLGINWREVEKGEKLDWGGWKMWRTIYGRWRDDDKRQSIGKNGCPWFRRPRLSDGRTAKALLLLQIVVHLLLVHFRKLPSAHAAHCQLVG